MDKTITAPNPSDDVVTIKDNCIAEMVQTANEYRKAINSGVVPFQYLNCNIGKMSKRKILKLKFYCRDLHKEVTVREFFKALLVKVWEDKAVFDGKRPWGFSHWDSDLINCLLKYNIIPDTLDDNGRPIECNVYKQREIIISIIMAL